MRANDGDTPRTRPKYRLAPAVIGARSDTPDDQYLMPDTRRQRGGRAEAGRHFQLIASTRVIAGGDVHQICPGRFHVGFHRGLRTVAQCHHGHHGANADDHPKHGEKRPQLVAAQRLECDTKTGRVLHICPQKNAVSLYS